MRFAGHLGYLCLRCGTPGTAPAPVACRGVVELTQAATWHRQVAALAAAAQRAGVADDQLPAVRARLLTQQARFAEAAGRTGVALPALAPTPTEIASAAPALGDLSPATVGETF